MQIDNNCVVSERTFESREKPVADHIIDLDLVSKCFCEAFLKNSLDECLQVRK